MQPLPSRISANRPFGVAVGELKKYANAVGMNHEFAKQLWATHRYEAQILAAFVDDPKAITIRQMNTWASDFDNWAIVDTVCFHLFDRTPHAWKQVPTWASARLEFKKRASFTLIWSLSTHDKNASDEAFLNGLEIIEKHAANERYFVKKAVDMALRATGKRNLALNKAAIKTAERLAQSDDKTRAWIGSKSLRELKSGKVQQRF